MSFITKIHALIVGNRILSRYIYSVPRGFLSLRNLRRLAKVKHLFPFGLLVVGITIFHWRGIRPNHVFLPVDLAQNNLP